MRISFKNIIIGGTAFLNSEDDVDDDNDLFILVAAKDVFFFLVLNDSFFRNRKNWVFWDIRYRYISSIVYI